MQELDARYVLPTRQAMSSRMIPQRYCEVKSDLRVRISHSKVRAVTTDMWTSSNNQAYMGVTAHWLDASFSMQSKCLAVKPAPGSHTAEFISAELTEVLHYRPQSADGCDRFRCQCEKGYHSDAPGQMAAVFRAHAATGGKRRLGSARCIGTA